MDLSHHRSVRKHSDRIMRLLIRIALGLELPVRNHESNRTDEPNHQNNCD